MLDSPDEMAYVNAVIDEAKESFPYMVGGSRRLLDGAGLLRAIT